MRKFTILCFIFCAGISFQTYGAAILSQAQIAEKAGDIIARDNAVVAGANVPHDTLIRQNKCNSFKNFIRHARDTLTPHDRNQAIIAIRNVINNPQLRNVFGQDLEDAAEFLKKRLLRSEIMNQNTPLIAPGAALNHLNNLIVRINNGAGTASGMLVPIPTIGLPAVVAARPITWKILTCAHAIPQNRLGDDNPILMRVDLPIGVVPITRMAIFKRPGREATVHNGAVALPQNTIVFDTLNPAGGLLLNNLRALPRYEDQGDIAWCNLPDNNHLHNLLTLHLNVPNGPGAAGFPVIAPLPGVGGHQVLTFNRALAGGNVTYNIHFVNAAPDAANIVGLVNAAPKQQNFIIGFTNFIAGGPTISKARNAATEVYANPNFIDPTAAGHNEFMFYHDAPSYWGMSGGPIFNVDIAANTVDIFGIVKGLQPQYAGPLASRCRGTFVRYF